MYLYTYIYIYICTHTYICPKVFAKPYENLTNRHEFLSSGTHHLQNLANC